MAYCRRGRDSSRGVHIPPPSDRCIAHDGRAGMVWFRLGGWHRVGLGDLLRSSSCRARKV